MNKKAIKRDSRAFICQGGHTNFISPSILKEQKLFWRLFADRTNEAKNEEEDLEEISVTTHNRVVTAATPIAAVTPAASTPPSALASVELDLANQVLRNLQVDYDNLLGKEANNSFKLEELQTKLRMLSEKLEAPS